MCYPRAVAAVGCLVVWGACTQAVVYDTALRPVQDPVMTATVDYGRFAVIETETGARAVLELEIEAPEEAADYLSLRVPTLRCIGNDVHSPTRIRQEAPICPAPASRSAGPCGPDDRAAGRCEFDQNPNMLLCLHVVRAEFEFTEIPHLDERTHFFTFDQRETEVQWARLDHD